MKKCTLIICFIFMCLTAMSQTISESYFKDREKYWATSFKNTIETNKAKSDTSHYDLHKNRAVTEKEILKYLFKAYQKITGKDLDTSNSIFLLKKKTQMRSDIVIWNSTDTIYTQTDLFIPHINDSQSIILYSFINEQINKERDYITTVMNMVSKVKPEEIQAIINKKTLDENGKIRLILDGSHFELYFFLKKASSYEVKKFLFSNPRVN